MVWKTEAMGSFLKDKTETEISSVKDRQLQNSGFTCARIAQNASDETVQLVKVIKEE